MWARSVDRLNDIARRRSVVVSLEQCDVFAQHFAVVRLINNVETLHTVDQRMFRRLHRDVQACVRRMRNEPAAQQLHKQWREIWRACLAWNSNATGLYRGTHELNDRVGRVQREPAPTTFKKTLKRLLFSQGRPHIAGIGDQQFRSADCILLRIVLANSRDNIGLFRQKLEQLQTREVGVVEARVAQQVHRDGFVRTHDHGPWMQLDLDIVPGIYGWHLTRTTQSVPPCAATARSNCPSEPFD